MNIQTNNNGSFNHSSAVTNSGFIAQTFNFLSSSYSKLFNINTVDNSTIDQKNSVLSTVYLSNQLNGHSNNNDNQVAQSTLESAIAEFNTNTYKNSWFAFKDTTIELAHYLTDKSIESTYSEDQSRTLMNATYLLTYKLLHLAIKREFDNISNIMNIDNVFGEGRYEPNYNDVSFSHILASLKFMLDSNKFKVADVEKTINTINNLANSTDGKNIAAELRNIINKQF